MNVITRAVSSTLGALKAFTMLWSRSSWGSSFGGGWLGATRLNIRGTVGDGTSNSMVLACTRWVTRTWPEAPLVVRQRDAKGQLEIVSDHALTMLLDRPNPFYSGVQMLTATLADRLWTGNAYWLKARNGAGRVVELWWVPSSLMAPVWPDNDPSVFISHYEYSPNGKPEPIPREDVIHFRLGFDPLNVRLGKSDLASLLGEVFTDEEASRYVSSILANMGVPGVVITPEGDTVATQEEADEVKSKFEQRFGGDRRGAPLVLKGAAKVSVLSFSPEQMTVRELRRIPEERVSGVLGIPAIVAGLGAGLDRSTFANMAEAREAAYESNIIPDHRLFAADLQQQLVPDFGDPAKIRVGFDYTQVRVLQQDQNALHERVRADLAAGGITLNQFLQETGRETIGPTGEVRYLGAAVSVKPADDLLPAPVALPEPTPLRALPEAASRRRAVEQKSIDDIPELFDLLREDDEPVWQEAMSDYLNKQIGRILKRMATGDEAASVLVPGSEAATLREALEPHQRATLESVRRIVSAELGVDFNLPDPAVRSYLREAGRNIKGITDHTRDVVRAELAAGQLEGEGIDALKRRLRQSVAFSSVRAETVSRTEQASAQNLSTRVAYKASGVVTGVRVLDSDNDPECEEWNGRVVSIDEADDIPVLGHPNCVRALSPVVSTEIEGAA
jgi:HK97 family phage portal protein